ncbi:testicular acid phosphatase homolog [Leptinotarsa decemlineata]|uniref:testicular acid phosphatase homolog n=1 Tax=Leptinotarsa decemlineata TaxID=7539 RepID=UPI003D303F67
MKLPYHNYILLALIILGSSEVSTKNSDELVAVAVLYRHGDRGPISSYPNDPYFDIKYWPNGFGQLVDQGKLNQFNLGKWLRRRYSGFISEKYNAQEIFVRSSDVDRTLMSAAANLAGLYYSTNSSEMWQDGLPWDPVPIHTAPEDDDEIVAMSKYCNKFETLYTELINSEYFEKVKEEHESLFSFVSLKTGWNVTDISTFQGLYTTFYVYRTLNPSFLPEWSSRIDEREISYLAGLSFSRETFTKDLQRLKVGPFMNYLNTHFDGAIEGTSTKFLMISGHDGTIAGILNTFGAYDYHPPEFSSTIIWELRKSPVGIYYLNIFYKRNSTESLEKITIEGCTLDCAYDEYKNLLKSIAVDSTEWEKECRNDGSI